MRKEISPIASPDLIQFAPNLPKTRSGKIMRRILRKIAEDEFGNLGDTSTLADPAVVDDLVKNRQKPQKRIAFLPRYRRASMPAGKLAWNRLAICALLAGRKGGGARRTHPTEKSRKTSTLLSHTC